MLTQFADIYASLSLNELRHRGLKTSVLGTDDIFKQILMKENVFISIQMSPKSIHLNIVGNTPPLV